MPSSASSKRLDVRWIALAKCRWPTDQSTQPDSTAIHASNPGQATPKMGVSS